MIVLQEIIIVVVLAIVVVKMGWPCYCFKFQLGIPVGYNLAI